MGEGGVGPGLRASFTLEKSADDRYTPPTFPHSWDFPLVQCGARQARPLSPPPRARYLPLINLVTLLSMFTRFDRSHDVHRVLAGPARVPSPVIIA